jgi:hypothetical protein
MTSLTNFERLSLVLQANQSVGDDYFVDPKLVGELVTSGQEWALRWEYGWLEDESHPLDAVVAETTKIFEMFRHLQSSADGLDLDKTPPTSLDLTSTMILTPVLPRLW